MDGVKAVAGQSGDKDPRMKQVLNDIDHVRSGDPNGDAQLAPQQQKVIDELWGRLSGGVSSATLHDRGTTLISQPVRGGDDGSFTPPSGRSLLTSTVKPVKDHSNYVNPGSGDDGNVAVTGGTGSASPRQIPGVKDPPKPGTDTDPSKPAGGTGGPTAPTGAPHNAQ